MAVPPKEPLSASASLEGHRLQQQVPFSQNSPLHESFSTGLEGKQNFFFEIQISWEWIPKDVGVI